MPLLGREERKNGSQDERDLFPFCKTRCEEQGVLVGTSVSSIVKKILFLFINKALLTNFPFLKSMFLDLWDSTLVWLHFPLSGRFFSISFSGASSSTSPLGTAVSPSSLLALCQSFFPSYFTPLIMSSLFHGWLSNLYFQPRQFSGLLAQQSHFFLETYLDLYDIQTLQIENIWSTLFISTLQTASSLLWPHSPFVGKTGNSEVFPNSIFCLIAQPANHQVLIMPPST